MYYHYGIIYWCINIFVYCIDRAREADSLKDELVKAKVAEKSAKEKLQDIIVRRTPSYSPIHSPTIIQVRLLSLFGMESPWISNLLHSSPEIPECSLFAYTCCII